VTLEGIDVKAILGKIEVELAQVKDLPPSLKALIEVLLLVVKLLSNRVGLNSRNSSKPPSSDPNRKKSNKDDKGKSDKKPGGQNGHKGKTLKQIDEPDEVEKIEIDRRKLPKGNYTDVGFEKRQVFEICFCRNVIEYQAQVLEDENGKRFVASFPQGVTKAVQYGNSLKAHAVYMSQYQLIPYNRVQEYFAEQLQIPISQGSIYNFNQDAFKKLTAFSDIVKDKLAASSRMHVDETGVNLDGKRHWLHCASNDLWTDFSVHKKRGCEAMNDRGIIPRFIGVLCHDHWKPYYKYMECLHALCNAHHIRELTRAYEQDGQEWALKMKELLEEINKAVHNQNGSLDDKDAANYLEQYRELLKEADAECPPPDETQKENKRGRVKRSKARNLLERLLKFESDVLRFMTVPDVPFTNNLGENDIRMTKVQQKISGCFRSMEGAESFCRVRSYLSTCRKQGMSSSRAMELLFEGKLPDFCL